MQNSSQQAHAEPLVLCCLASGMSLHKHFRLAEKREGRHRKTPTSGGMLSSVLQMCTSILIRRHTWYLTELTVAFCSKNTHQVEQGKKQKENRQVELIYGKSSIFICCDSREHLPCSYTYWFLVALVGRLAICGQVYSHTSI